MTQYKRWYEGVRWTIWFGSYEGPEKFALEELQREVQCYQPYVVGVKQISDEVRQDPEHLILLGTPENSFLLGELQAQELINVPEQEEGYSIACLDSPWKDGQRIIAIAGRDARGVVYGVADFSSRILGNKVATDLPGGQRESFDKMESFNISEYPRIERRGLWGWGYVIYDFRRFIDNMARLKMNTLIVWNDCPPLNCQEVIEYAHSRGVSVILGFHWGWDIEGLDPSSHAGLQRIKAEVIENYEQNYRHLGADGIYFQTFTEQHNTQVGGRSIASLACEWVNDIALTLLEKEPGLEIQFGLHAISIREDYVDLKDLDPRVSIVWEDAGVLPYDYNVATCMEGADWAVPVGLETVEATVDYSKRLAVLREGAEFAMVAKGWMKLRWGIEFEHHGPFILGERKSEFIARRLTERQPRWDYANSQWMRNYPIAASFYREILGCSPSKMSVTGLIEDGMFEETIQPSVGLFAETIWNPYREDSEILALALSPYYRRNAP